MPFKSAASLFIYSLCFFFSFDSSGQSCQEKIERIIKEISETREVRFHGLSQEKIKYRSAILDTELRLKRRVPHVNGAAEQRLAKMFDNSNPADVKYLIETRFMEAEFSGGEASLFLNPKKPNEAIKVWHESRLEEFEISTRAMLLYEQKVSFNSSLRNVLSVSKIKERGRNFIVKEFSPHSRELKTVLSQAGPKKALSALKKELAKSSDTFSQKMLNALKREGGPSGNFHWDPDQNKILLIDALGF